MKEKNTTVFFTAEHDENCFDEKPGHMTGLFVWKNYVLKRRGNATQLRRVAFQSTERMRFGVKATFLLPLFLRGKHKKADPGSSPGAAQDGS